MLENSKFVIRSQRLPTCCGKKLWSWRLVSLDNSPIVMQTHRYYRTKSEAVAAFNEMKKGVTKLLTATPEIFDNKDI